MLGIKRWFDKLFDSYLVEENVGFQVLIGKIGDLIWDYKEQERENFMGFKGCMNSIHEQLKKEK